MLHLQFKNRLKKNGLAITKHRLRVLKLFVELKKPACLKDIRMFLGGIDRVTIFRILNAFEKHNIIHVIVLENGQKLYALCDDHCGESTNCHAHEHVHFQCEDCLDVSCVPLKDFPKISLANYLVKHVSLNVSGLCVNCLP